MNWEKVKLGDACIKIGSGATPKGGASVYVDTGVTFIRSQNVYNLSFSYDGLVYINNDAAHKLEGVTIRENDILLNITGDSVARTCIVPSKLIPARVNQHVAIIRPKHQIFNPYFLSYYLASPFMQSFMLGLAVGKGASRNAMTKDMIANFGIPCPDLTTQNRIVNVLKPYNDLIENNQKQIKLLEEAAQRLYKEWFVDFRFPGHENTTFVDGLPEGWEYLPIKDAFSWIRGKSYTSLELSDTEGVKLVNLKNIKAFGGYNRGAEKRFTGSFKQEQLLQPGDVVMGVTDMTKERRLVGHVAIIPDLKEKMTFSMDLIKLLPNRISKCYLYSLMFFGGYSKKISPLANGTNVLHLKPETMNTMSILIPNKVIMTQYDDLFTYYNRKIEMLEDQIEVLKEARDRLLPKLMSGEIEV